MKKKIKFNNILQVLSTALFLLIFASCQKDASLTTGNTSTVSQSDIAGASAIAVGASSTSAGDSVYIVGTCGDHHHLDSIASGSFPASITDYLTANYSGYAFQKAYTEKDSTGTLSGYVVIIQYNGKPAGLKFDSAGSFVKVLEQRDGRDLHGHGWHTGGDFDDRGGMMHDTIAISALPSSVTSWFASNYPGDTLLHAFRNRDSSYVVLSSNNGAFATVFDANGAFVKRVQLPSHHHGQVTSVAQTALPSAAATYLATTYPNYVFKQAFKITFNGTTQGYIVFIDANATKYAAEFDSSGNFIAAVTIR